MKNQKRAIILLGGIGGLSLTNTKLPSIKSWLLGGRILSILAIVEHFRRFLTIILFFSNKKKKKDVYILNASKYVPPKFDHLVANFSR